MEFDEFEKDLIRKIAKGTISNMYQFVMDVPVGGSPPKRTNIAVKLPTGASSTPEMPLIVLQHPDKALTQCMTFVALWDYLVELKLIRNINLGLAAAQRIIFLKNEDSSFAQLDLLIFPYYEKTLVVLPPLKKFVERGFLTEEEFQHKEEREYWELEIMERKVAQAQEKRDRQKSMNLTMTVAVSSIVLGVGGAIFNYATYKTEREVIIKNNHAFQDTLTVRVADQNMVSKPDTTEQALPKAKTEKAKK